MIGRHLRADKVILGLTLLFAAPACAHSPESPVDISGTWFGATDTTHIALTLLQRGDTLSGSLEFEHFDLGGCGGVVSSFKVGVYGNMNSDKTFEAAFYPFPSAGCLPSIMVTGGPPTADFMQVTITKFGGFTYVPGFGSSFTTILIR